MDGQEKWTSRKNSYNEGTKEGTNERKREIQEGRMKGEGRKEGRAPRKEQSKGGRKQGERRKDGRNNGKKKRKKGGRKTRERGTGVVGEAMRNRGHVPAVQKNNRLKMVRCKIR